MTLCFSACCTVDLRRALNDLADMIRPIAIDARWDAEAGVWIATSHDVTGLVVEANTWSAMIEEVGLVLPDLLDASDTSGNDLALTFRAEQHLQISGA